MAERSFQSLFAHPSIKRFNPYSQSVFTDLHTCHTAGKGYHLSVCDNSTCQQMRHQYHCCGNRHCPHCGSMKREAWIEDRRRELLPTPYYHGVFTLPQELNALVMGNRDILLNALFASASQTLLNHGKNETFLGAELGITMVLHTWGQDLSFHPHGHCIVTGGGWTGKKWVVASRKNNRFLFPQKSLATMYKAIFMKVLQTSTELKWGQVQPAKLFQAIRYKTWNVYAKAPFGGPAQVVEYLGRYTHKIAITQHRILEVNHNQIKFRYKDYADQHKIKEMWLSHEEFLRRFEQHILPKGFVKIRHYGFLRSKDKHTRIALIRQDLSLPATTAPVQIPMAIRMLEKYGRDISGCPGCQTGRLVLLHDTRKERREKQRPLPHFVPP